MSADPGLSELTSALLDAAKRFGADQADAMAVRGEMTSVDTRAGGLEHAERAETVEIGLRVLLGGRQACVSASDHSAATIVEMAERAVTMARHSPADEWLGLAEATQLSRRRDADGLEPADPGEAPAPSSLEETALRAEASAAAVPGISQVEASSASYSRRQMWIAASNGFAGGYARTSHAISTVAITGEGTGMERDHAGESRVWASDLPLPEDIGRLAGERTVARKGARKPPTGPFPILFDRRVSASIIGHLLGAVNGSAIARGASWLLRALEEQVLPDTLTLTEDPHRPRFGSSRLFDAEGLPTQQRRIVDQGQLMGWSLDLATGRKLGMVSTASASRGLSSPPSPGHSNVILSGGISTREDLIRDMGRGLVVTSMLGASINPTTGDYSRGAAGFWVENGAISHAVNECTIAGNLRGMLLRMQAADDAERWRGVEVPSLLIEGMTVAGA